MSVLQIIGKPVYNLQVIIILLCSNYSQATSYVFYIKETQTKCCLWGPYYAGIVSLTRINERAAPITNTN